MKTLISICVCLLLAFISTQNMLAQPEETVTLGTLIEKSELKDITFYHLHSDSKGKKLFFYLKGRGHVDHGNFKLIVGGGDPDSIDCMVVLEYAPDMTLVREQIYALEIEGIKEKTVITSLKKQNRIADAKRCYGYDWEAQLVKLYPELLDRKTEKEPEEVLTKFYDNSVSYRFSGVPNKIRRVEYKLKERDPDAKKETLFTKLIDLNKSDYTYESSEIDLSPYKGETKQVKWIRQYRPECDLETGTLYAWHFKSDKNIKMSKSKYFFHEFVVFDRDGKILNETEMLFDLPHEFVYRGVLRSRGKDEIRYTYQSFIHVYRQAHGFGFKKLNPNPDKMVRQVYHWDKLGKLINQKSFNVPNEETRFYVGLPTDQTITLIGADKKDLYTIQSKPDKLTELTKVDPNSSVLKYHQMKTEDFLFTNWTFRANIASSENKSLFIHDLHRKYYEMKITDTVYLSPGLVLTAVDDQGNLERIFSYPSPEGRNQKKATTFEILENEGDRALIAIHFPLVPTSCSTHLYEIDLITFEQTFLGSVDAYNPPTFINKPETEEVFVLYRDPMFRKLYFKLL